MAGTESRLAGLSGSAQIRLLALIFAMSVIALGAGYYFFLRTEYIVLFNDLRPADASALVAELDRRSIAYELRDGGAAIAVPEDEAASARVAIAGSDITSGGAVGFELFNESDMGLTDFAQRINYQRALQGELARTIMMMGGIESARVHLAMPERSLFRGNRGQPKAAVTVTPTRGRGVDAARVAGIQRLVAAAVPDLALRDVVVLDEVGRVISRIETTETFLPADLAEHEAVQQYYRARARAAVENVLPGLAFDVRVSVLSAPVAADGATWQDEARASAEPAAPEAATGPAAEEPAAPAAAGRRNFRLRIVLVTEGALAAGDRELAISAISGAVDLDERDGDGLVFAVGPIGGAVPAPPSAESLPLVATEAAPGSETGWTMRPAGWWLMFAILVGLFAMVMVMRLRGTGMAPAERDAFVQRIRHQLQLAEEGGDVRA